MNYDSKNEITAFLEKRGLSPRKRFGQNFLVSGEVRKKIMSLVDIKPGSVVWEIGPGLGAMTELALEKTGSGRLDVFEIDKGYIEILKDLFSGHIGNGNLEIIEGDFLKTWKGRVEQAGLPERIFGNLPYNCASAIIASLIEDKVLPEKMVFTVQKEVAERMAAKPGSSDYSSFSVICQSFCSVTIEFDIRGGSFYPVPDVTSSVVTLVPQTACADIGNVKKFSSFLRILFNSRRKTVLNNLRVFGKDKAESSLRKLSIDPGIRAEKLGIESIVTLFHEFYQDY